MDELSQAINTIIDNSVSKINEIVKKEHPKILAKLAKEIFESVGQSHGREWQPNTSATVNGFYSKSPSGISFHVKGKGFNRRNYETGQLMNTLTEVGFLEDDNYMENLPTAPRGNSYGYKAANSINSFQNRFDDIGRTPDDEEYISNQLAEAIIIAFAGT